MFNMYVSHPAPVNVVFFLFIDVDPCAGRPNQLCQAVAGGVCIPQTSGDLCNYYCKCPGKPLDCQQQWCDDEPNCESSKKLDSKMFWKRQDTFEDFNPHEV